MLTTTNSRGFKLVNSWEDFWKSLQSLQPHVVFGWCHSNWAKLTGWTCFVDFISTDHHPSVNMVNVLPPPHLKPRSTPATGDTPRTAVQGRNCRAGWLSDGNFLQPASLLVNSDAFKARWCYWCTIVYWTLRQNKQTQGKDALFHS